MTPEELWGKYLRLREELAEACAARRWHAGRIDRLADDMVAVQRALANLLPADEQTSEMLPGV